MWSGGLDGVEVVVVVLRFYCAIPMKIRTKRKQTTSISDVNDP